LGVPTDRYATPTMNMHRSMRKTLVFQTMVVKPSGAP